MSFPDLGLGDDVLRAVADAGYDTPTPIQAAAIPTVLMGRDILAVAQTGTGKTASFTLPMIDILAHGRAKARMPRSLILEPTRELAAQVAENFDTYGKYHKLSKALLIGGTNMREQQAILERGVDVLIATPGRLLDMFERGHLLMNDVKTLVIDEADRMLDMGFIPDVEKIVARLSPIRQTLFFSATMAPAIKKLSDQFLMNPKEITVAAPASAAETVTQGLLIVPHGDGRKPGGGMKEKREALRKLIAKEDVRDAIIFCNRKRDISTLHRSMSKRGFSVGQLHGDMSQPSRMEMLQDFKAKKVTYLICSDVAARGLDIPNLSHVFNFDVPIHAEDYVHRIGRTGRAGKEGRAFSICVPEDAKYVKAIEALIKREIPLLEVKGVNKTALKGDTPVAEADNKPDNSEKSGERSGRTRNRRGGRNRRPDAATDDTPKEGATEAVAEAPAEAVAEAPAEAVVEAPVEAPVEAVVEVVAEAAPAPVEVVAEAVVEAAPEASPEAVAEETTQAPNRQPRQRRSRSPRSDRNERNGRSDRNTNANTNTRGERTPGTGNNAGKGDLTKGMGDHVPAFLLVDPTAVVTPKKKPVKKRAPRKRAPKKETAVEAVSDVAQESPVGTAVDVPIVTAVEAVAETVEIPITQGTPEAVQDTGPETSVKES